jgi:hypothetical protein
MCILQAAAPPRAPSAPTPTVAALQKQKEAQGHGGGAQEGGRRRGRRHRGQDAQRGGDNGSDQEGSGVRARARAWANARTGIAAPGTTEAYAPACDVGVKYAATVQRAGGVGSSARRITEQYLYRSFTIITIRHNYARPEGNYGGS